MGKMYTELEVAEMMAKLSVAMVYEVIKDPIDEEDRKQVLEYIKTVRISSDILTNTVRMIDQSDDPAEVGEDAELIIDGFNLLWEDSPMAG